MNRTLTVIAACGAGAALGFGSLSWNDGAMDERFGPIGDLAGHAWEIEATWADGSPLSARNEFRQKMNGQFMEARTFANDGAGMYERYLTIYSVVPGTGTLVAHGFTYDGTTSTQIMSRSVSDDGDPVYGAEWTAGPADMKQEIELEGDRYRWRVWTRPSDSPIEWMPLMDGVWRRAEKL